MNSNVNGDSSRKSGSRILPVEKISERQEKLEEQIDSAKTVGVSDMASQLYCKKKLDLRREHGEVDNDFKRRGREGHEAVRKGYKKIETGHVWRKIEDGTEVTLQEFPLRHELDDILLLGRTDLVHFEDAKPKVLIEVKFTHGSVQDTFRNEEFQTWIYSRMLDGMGFDTRELRYAVLKTGVNNRERKSYIENIRDDAVEMLLRNPDVGFTEFLDRTFVFPNKYRRQDWESEFEWSLEYWRNEREPLATNRMSKCLSCEYEERCEESNK